MEDPATIAIAVGSLAIKFFITSDMVEKRSEFLQKAIKDLVDSPRQIIKLPDLDPESFAIYVQSLYTGEVLMFEAFDENMQEEYDSDTERKPRATWPPPEDKEWIRWRDCYALGEFLRDSDFQDACIDALLERLYDRQIPVHGLAHYIYSHSAVESVHRDLVVDFFINCRLGKRHLADFHAKTDCCDACKEFSFDVLQKLVHDASYDMNDSNHWEIRQMEIWEVVTCMIGTYDYHDHERRETPCYQDKWKGHIKKA